MTGDAAPRDLTAVQAKELDGRWVNHLAKGRPDDPDWQDLHCGGGVCFPGSRVKVSRDTICPDCLRAAKRLTGDAAVEWLAGKLNTDGSALGEAEEILDALPALLREDGPAGDALRARLGFKVVVTGWYESTDGFWIMAATSSRAGQNRECRSLRDVRSVTRKIEPLP